MPKIERTLNDFEAWHMQPNELRTASFGVKRTSIIWMRALVASNIENGKQWKWIFIFTCRRVSPVCYANYKPKPAISTTECSSALAALISQLAVMPGNPLRCSRMNTFTAMGILEFQKWNPPVVLDQVAGRLAMSLCTIEWGKVGEGS